MAEVESTCPWTEEETPWLIRVLRDGSVHAKLQGTYPMCCCHNYFTTYCRPVRSCQQQIRLINNVILTVNSYIQFGHLKQCGQSALNIKSEKESY